MNLAAPAPLNIDDVLTRKSCNLMTELVSDVQCRYSRKNHLEVLTVTTSFVRQVRHRFCVVRPFPGEALLHAAVLPLRLDPRRASDCRHAVLLDHSGNLSAKSLLLNCIFVQCLSGYCQELVNNST